ncbi:MAG TPA: hypothetical protein VK524_29900 [Polyangiaceae bacterium]|nr:hypothetical protein [Polyangiaceae bacterium]
MGHSPFHVKGTIWLGTRAYYEKQIPGGPAAVATKLNSAHAEFLMQMFMPLSWYDLLPMVEISRAASTLMGMGHPDWVRMQALASAERDMTGTYKALLKSSSPEAVCKRFPSIYAQLYDFGECRVISSDSRSVESCVYGMPEPAAEWWMKATEAYMSVILNAAGAKSPKLVFQPLAPDGTLCRVPLVRVRSRTIWK